VAGPRLKLWAACTWLIRSGRHHVIKALTYQPRRPHWVLKYLQFRLARVLYGLLRFSLVLCPSSFTYLSLPFLRSSPWQPCLFPLLSLVSFSRLFSSLYFVIRCCLSNRSMTYRHVPDLELRVPVLFLVPQSNRSRPLVRTTPISTGLLLLLY